MDEILVVVICLALNSLLAAYEMAFVSISRSELKALAKSGDKLAKSLLLLREKPERTLSVIQIGITLVGAVAAAVGGAGAAESIMPIFMQKFSLSERGAEMVALIIVVLPITYLSVVVGELVPKTLALRNPTKIVLLGAKTLFIMDRILSPVISVLEWSTQKILNVFFPRSKQIKEVEQVTIDLNELSPIHKNYMLNMADIETKHLREILVPWSQVVYIQSTFSIEEVFQIVINSGHTRLPVEAHGTILGVLHTKEFMALQRRGSRTGIKSYVPSFI